MTINALLTGRRHRHVGGHDVLSVSAIDEPERQQRKALADLASAIPHADACAASGISVSGLVTTPDFHPGKPVPVGVAIDVVGGVMPHLIGNDIGCGMRMIVLKDVAAEDLRPELDGHLRHVFFQGGRHLGLTGRSRRAVLHDGLPGLLESLPSTRPGLLRNMDILAAWRDLDSTSGMGRFEAGAVIADFERYAMDDDEVRFDGVLGSIGGGNHFVEFGRVSRIVDGGFARTAGLERDSIVIVVHSGSLDFGQRVGASMRSALLARKGTVPDHRIVSAKRDAALFERFRIGQANAANLAFANRFFLGLQAVEALARAIGREIEHSLVYDSPHNMAWIDGENARHRKGACPARGTDDLESGRYRYLGEPVILPGSMGDGTWLLSGLGDEAMLSTAAHGAGRRLSRQEARREDSSPLDDLRVVGPVDLRAPAMRGRSDVLSEAIGRLKEEAPKAYRPIDSVVEAMTRAKMARRVARIDPLLTVKG